MISRRVLQAPIQHAIALEPDMKRKITITNDRDIDVLHRYDDSNFVFFAPKTIIFTWAIAR